MGKKTDLPIGVFDSGLGGLTVVRQLRRILPNEDIVFLGDTARVPYGAKSALTVTRFACEDANFLIHQNVKAVVAACNTVSALAMTELERRFKVPIFGVILPGAKEALRRTRSGRIGVIATSATIRSKAYSTAILARDDTAEVFATPCPLLVPLVEEGWNDHEVTRLVLKEYLEPLLRNRIDTLVLGCTHYPLLKKALRHVVGREVKLVDSAASCARFVAERLELLKLLRRRSTRRGSIQTFVTDEPVRFDELARRFLGFSPEPAWKVALQSG